MVWRVGPDPARHVFDRARPAVMGIVNTTPDSFSDAGLAFAVDGDPGPAIAHGRALVAAGAAIIDVGGESTRPGAAGVDAATERSRVVPVVEALAADGVVVSIDTTKAAVAAAALDAGAMIVNDVSAGRLDPDLLPLVVERDVPYVLMHMQGTPRTMQAAPAYDDVVADVMGFLAERLGTLVDAGLAMDRIAVDPGIGFGKTVEHNLDLLRAVDRFAALAPVLVGVSRKSFLGAITGVDEPRARDPASAAVAALAVAGGACVVRAHEVAATRQAVAVGRAMGARRRVDPADPVTLES